MGFTFHKLYPMIYPTAIDCCDFTAAELRALCQFERPNNDCPPCTSYPCGYTICNCLCPLPALGVLGDGRVHVTRGCNPNPPDCGECYEAICYYDYFSFTWLCVTYGEQECRSVCSYYHHCPEAGGWCGGIDRECCPTITIPGSNECVSWNWLWTNFGWSSPDGDVSSAPNLFECVIEGAVPKTYRMENVGVGSEFMCGTGLTSVKYEILRNSSNGQPTSDGYVRGDPALTSPVPYNQRFYKDLNGTTYALGVTGASASYSTYCLKLHSTPSQAEGIENRVMFIAGRNIYRYTGPLSGDPQLSSYGAASDPFWNSGGMTGVTGIKQWEESISERTFPLPDTTMILPLWGQTANNNLGINFGSGAEDCENPYWDFYYSGGDLNNEGNPVCVGCRCVRTSADEATGHYLSTEHFGSSSGKGYTAGYFSFASFNPHCYLDHIRSEPGNTAAIVPLHDTTNLLSGTVSSDYFNCSSCDPGSPIGISGATCHGERLGVPACSVWSLMKALYSRVLHAVQRNDFITVYQIEPYSESTFRDVASPTGFKPFVDALDAMLADNPSELTSGGTSKVQYHLARVSNELEICSRSLFKDYSSFGNGTSLDDGSRFRFTFPNVFLWDRSAYTSASAADKWKHLYVVGNGNIIHDSGSVAIEQPYNLDWEDIVPNTGDGLSADIVNQNFKSSVFYLNAFNHQLGPIVGQGTTSHHARMIVFNGSGGPTSDATGEFTRRNAKSQITLAAMPVCDTVTLPEGTFSPCSLCNAFPNFPPCTPIAESANECDVINVFPSGTGDIASYIENVMCIGQDGFGPPEFNSLTASYQI